MTGLLMALVLSAQPGSADDVVAKAFAEPVVHAQTSPSPGSSLFGWGLALVTICAVAAMALKRRSQKPEAGFAEVAQNLSVGPKRALLVVNFAGKRMLVGSTESGFSVLSSEAITTTDFDTALAEQKS